MDVLLQDVRYAARSLVKNWVFTVPAVLSLALGLGATATIVTFIHAIFAHPLDVREPAELVAVASRSAEEPGRLPVSYPNYVDYRENSGVFTDLAAGRWLSVDLDTREGPQRIFGELVTPNYFEVLGVGAAAGRTLVTSDGGAADGAPLVVLSHSLWQRHFGGEPGVVGRSVRVNGHPFEIVGVAEKSFRGLNLLRAPEIWVSIGAHHQILQGAAARYFDQRDGLLFDVVGRLRAGIDLRQASAAMEVLTRSLVRAYPDKNRGLGVALDPLVDRVLPERFRGRFVLAGWLFMGAVSLLLAIACMNVANLLVARALARRRETAVRLAMGCGQLRIVQQLMTEGLLLTLLGGVAGLWLATSGCNLLWKLRPSFMPDKLDVGLNPAVVGIAAALTLVVGVLFSLAPALQSLHVDIASELKERAGGGSSRGRLKAKGALVVLQVALSVIILFGAGLFMQSLGKLRRVEPGYVTENLFLIPVAIGAQGYSQAEGLAFYDRLVERITAIGGVEDAAVSRRPVLAPGGPRTGIESEDPDVREKTAGALLPYNLVGTGYFDTVGIELREGRAFEASDREGGRRVMVVNETMARWLWPGRSAVGEEVIFEGEETPTAVVGVVEDAKHGSLAELPGPYIYVPVSQSYSPSMILHVRSRGSPAVVSQLVRQEIHALEPKLALLETRFIHQLVDTSLWASRVIAGLLSVFGLLALVLAAVGLYGVLAYGVHLSRREIGIRMAMGADRRGVLRLVARQALTMVGLGIVSGLAVSIGAYFAVTDLLFEVAPFDPATVGLTVAVLGAAALAAAWMPARRAVRVDPMLVLRDE